MRMNSRNPLANGLALLLLMVVFLFAACTAPVVTPTPIVITATEAPATQTPFVITATPAPVTETPATVEPTETPDDPTPTQDIISLCFDPGYSNSHCPINEGTMRGAWETENYNVGTRDFTLMHPAGMDLLARAIETTQGGYVADLDGDLFTMFCQYAAYDLVMETTGRTSYDAACSVEPAYKAAEVTFRQHIDNPGIRPGYPLVIRVVARAALNHPTNDMPPGLFEIQPRIFSTVSGSLALQAQNVPDLTGDNEFLWVVKPSTADAFVLDIVFRTRYAEFSGHSKFHIIAIEIYEAPTPDYGGPGVPTI